MNCPGCGQPLESFTVKLLDSEPAPIFSESAIRASFDTPRKVYHSCGQEFEIAEPPGWKAVYLLPKVAARSS